MGNNGNSYRLNFPGLQNHCSYEIKICLLLGTKAMTNLDSMLKSRDITLPWLNWIELIGLKLMITSCFSSKHMECNLITVLSWIWVLIIYQTKHIFQEFRTMDQDVYWKEDWGLRVLYWLPSNFYLKAIQIQNKGTSLVVQWISQCRGHGFDPWSRKIPYAIE